MDTAIISALSAVLFAEQYFAPNMSVEEMRELALSNREDPLRVFSETCREELKALRRVA